MFINDQCDFAPSKQFANAFRAYIDDCINKRVWTTMLDVVRMFCGR